MSRFQLILLLVVLPSFAEEQTKWRCLQEDIAILDKHIILNATDETEKDAIYFLQNVSEQNIWIDHSNEEAPRLHTTWASQLKPYHWSAIAISEQHFKLSCAHENSALPDDAPCQTVLAVCKTNLFRQQKFKSNFWLLENMEAGTFIRAVFAKLKKNSLDDS